MQHKDYPALYGDADRASLLSQKHFFRALVSNLSFLVLSAVLALVAYPSPYFAALQAALLLGSLALTIYLAYAQPQRIWYGTRALAESIKTITWRYAMRAEPYQSDEDSARNLFILNAQKILADNDVSRHAVAYSDGDQISPEMNRLRALPLLDRRTVYLTDRIDQQLSWYRTKATTSDSVSKRWFVFLVAVQTLAIACAIGRIINPNFVYWPSGILASIATGVLGWLQAKRFQDIAVSYSLTAHDIALLREKLQDVASDQDFSAFVGDAENAFSREHTQWRARRDVG